MIALRCFALRRGCRSNKLNNLKVPDGKLNKLRSVAPTEQLCNGLNSDVTLSTCCHFGIRNCYCHCCCRCRCCYRCCFCWLCCCCWSMLVLVIARRAKLRNLAPKSLLYCGNANNLGCGCQRIAKFPNCCIYICRECLWYSIIYAREYASICAMGFEVVLLTKVNGWHDAVGKIIFEFCAKLPQFRNSDVYRCLV